jgi:membrane protease YdiL (CAAX protease family)
LTSSEPPSGLEPGRADGSAEPPAGPPETAVPGKDPAGAPPLTPPATPARLGTGTFTIEGRSAPALFVVGWLATLVGIGLVAVGIMSSDTTAARILVIVGLIPLAVGLIAGAGSQAIERRARGRLPYQGPSPFLVLLASVPISLLAVLAASLPLSFFGVALDGPFGALLSVTIQAAVYVGLVRLLVVDAGALDWAAMGVRRPDGRAVFEGLGCALWALPVVFVTGILVSILLQAVPVEPVSPLPPTGTNIGFALSFLAGALVAPFGEEILFRAFATTAWVRGLGVARGVVLGALVFAFAHVLTISGSSAGDAFQQAFVAFVGRIPIALALGWLFVRRGTVWASFGLHAAFNAILLVLAEVVSRST